MRSFEEVGRTERPPELRRRLRRTAWIIAAVIATLGIGASCFIAKNGRKSRTVLHSRLDERMLNEENAEGRSDLMDVMEPAEHAAHPKPAFYWKIWAWLLALTVLEVLASLKLTLPKGEMIVLLVGMAIVKAVLVALYFMHLRYERVSLGITISLTLVLALILVFANMMQWLFHSPSTVMPPR